MLNDLCQVELQTHNVGATFTVVSLLCVMFDQCHRLLSPQLIVVVSNITR